MCHLPSVLWRSGILAVVLGAATPVASEAVSHPVRIRAGGMTVVLEHDVGRVAKLLAASDVWVMPQPKQVAALDACFDLRNCGGIRLVGCGRRDIGDFADLLKQRSGISLSAVTGEPKAGCICFGLFPSGVTPRDFPGIPNADLRSVGSQGYVVSVGGHGVSAAATDQKGLFYAARTIAQIATDRTRLPGIVIRDWPSLAYRGVHEDISRGQVPTIDTLKRLTRVAAEAKVNMLELYIEHVFKWTKHPDVCPPEGITPQEGRELFDYGARYNIEVHPMLQVLGHSHGILHLPQYHHLRVSESKKAPWIMTFDIRKPEAIAFVGDLVDEICRTFPGEFLNVDITEIDMEGLKQSGTTVEQTTQLIYNYVLKLREMVRPYGMRLMIAQGPVSSTGDLGGIGPMIDKLPKDIVITSYYTAPPGVYGHACETDYPLFNKLGLDFFAQPWINSHIRIIPDTIHSADFSDGMVGKGVEYGALGSVTSDWGDDGHYHLTGQTWYPYLYHGASAWTGAKLDRGYFDQTFTRLIYGIPDDSVARAVNLLGGINGQKVKVTNDKGEIVDAQSYHYWEFWQDPFTHPDIIRLADPAGMARDVLAPANKAARILELARGVAKRNVDNIDQLIFGARNYQAMGRKLRITANYRDDSCPRARVASELLELVRTYEEMRTEFSRLWLAEDRENDGFRALLNRFDNTIAPCKQKAEELSK